MTNPLGLSEIFQRIGGVEPAVGKKLNPLDSAAIADIESAVGARLPETYRSFLTSFGAVIFSETVLYQPATPFPRGYSRDNCGIVEMLLGRLHPQFPKAKKISILHRLKTLQDAIPSGMIPFADNGAGDILFLQVRGESPGSVYLWDHENRGGTSSDVYPVSSSFEKWLDGLTLS